MQPEYILSVSILHILLIIAATLLFVLLEHFIKVLSLCLSKNRNEKCFSLECEEVERRAVKVMRISRLWRSGLS